MADIKDLKNSMYKPKEENVQKLKEYLKKQQPNDIYIVKKED